MNWVQQTFWSSLDLLGEIKAVDFKIDEEKRRRFEPALWNDLCSEYDSRHFYRNLVESGLDLSLELQELIASWSYDETNHYLGFLKIYSMLYGESEQAVQIRLRGRKSSFEDLKVFFEDELKLCLLLAYDELVTTLSYHSDQPFYRSLGPQRLVEWIVRVKRDEARHLGRLLSVIREKHFHRIGEADAIILRILDLDLDARAYKATFVLDHQGEIFDRDMLKSCADSLMRRVRNMKEGE